MGNRITMVSLGALCMACMALLAFLSGPMAASAAERPALSVQLRTDRIHVPLPASMLAAKTPDPLPPAPSLATSIIDLVNQRLCEKQAALGSLIPLVAPSKCAPTPPPADEPTVEIDADPLTITAGASTTLSWESEDADSCTASNGWSGTKATSGTEAFSPATTTTYAITCTGEGGTAEDSVTVTVTPAPGALTLTLTVDPPVVHEGSAFDATTTLTWSSTGADSCTASGAADWTGSKAFSGNATVTPTATTTYELDCTDGGSGTVHAEVTVGFVPQAEPEPDAPTVDITASRMTVFEGSAGEATTTLSWTSTNADSCVASNAWDDSIATSGEAIVTPTATSTYAIQCTGPGGTAQDSVTVDFVSAEEPEQTIGHVVISEVHYDVASSTVSGNDSSFEWVELYNGTASAIDLQGWRIGDETATDTIAVSVLIQPGSYAVIVASTTPSGIPAGVPVIVLQSGIGSNGFANGGDAARLFDASGLSVDEVGYGDNATTTPNVSIPATTAERDGHSIARTQLTSDTDTAADWADVATPTPGQ